MSPVGYSGTPLRRKLGIGEQTKVCLINAPVDYFNLFDPDIRKQVVDVDEGPDLIHLFVTTYQQFHLEMKKLRSIFESNPSTVIWVSWYKKASGLKTDMSENVIRDYALANGLVDVKVCAVTNIWSGLKLVVPKHLR